MANFEAYIQSQLDMFNGFTERVQKEIVKNLRHRKASISGFISKCESPIEQLLGIYLVDLEGDVYRELTVLQEFESFIIHPQKEVEIKGYKYRLDFLLECRFDYERFLFAVECDGHDFHEKTKEQAVRDKSRDRNLTTEGYTVVRFTGSEIWKNPVRCSGEISRIINKTVGLDDYYEKLINNRYSIES